MNNYELIKINNYMLISRLHYITQDVFDFNHVQLAEEACKGGADWVQLRVKNTYYAKYLQIALDTQAICKKYNAKLIINDNVEIAKEINADGVHLGKTDMGALEARKILGNDIIIGCSANTFEDIERLSTFNIDYIGLGPFRFTTTKENISPIIGIKGYETIMNKCKLADINIPIIAIGGININDIEEILKTGIHGIAISSSINFSKNKQMQTHKIITIINNNLK